MLSGGVLLTLSPKFRGRALRRVGNGLVAASLFCENSLSLARAYIYMVYGWRGWYMDSAELLDFVARMSKLSLNTSFYKK